MNKQQAINFLEKAGIWVKDGRIARADYDKAVATLSIASDEPAKKLLVKAIDNLVDLKWLLENDGNQLYKDVAKARVCLTPLEDKLLRAKAFEEQIPGGLSSGKNPKDFDQKELLMGINVEVEHTDDVLMAMEIAMDHLTEKANYYTELKKVEDA